MSSPNCGTCKKYCGLDRRHNPNETCPLRECAWCPKCSSKGHLASECSVTIAWDRPEYLEDLIPEDVKLRWNIRTKTRILYEPLVNGKIPLEIAEREITNTSSIEGYEKDNNPLVKGNLIELQLDDKEIREFMKNTIKLKTERKMEDNITKIRGWATGEGQRVVFTNLKLKQ